MSPSSKIQKIYCTIANNNLIISVCSLVTFLLCISCSYDYPFRKTLAECNCETTNCDQCALEIHQTSSKDGLGKRYEISFVEFDDNGMPMLAGQRSLLSTILEGNLDRDLIILAYVHGWYHNASGEDGDVQGFRSLLMTMQEEENARGSHRQVLGVYIGWRGMAWKIKQLFLLTFEARYEAAKNIGVGSLYSLLLMLNDFYVAKNPSRDPNGTRLFIVGHSLGGQIVFQALKSELRNRVHVSIFASDDKNCPPVIPFADTVILVNPTLTARDYEPIYNESAHRCYPSDQPPVMIVALSETDDVVQNWFRLSRLIAGRAADPGLDRSVAAYPLSCVEKYQTHTLSPMKLYSAIDLCKPDLIRADRTSCTEMAQPIGDWTLVNLCVEDNIGPFVVLVVDKSILNGHGGFMRTDLSNFLVDLIDDRVGARISPMPSSTGRASAGGVAGQ